MKQKGEFAEPCRPYTPAVRDAPLKEA